MRRRQFRLARTSVSIFMVLSLLTVVAVNREDVVQAERLATVLVTIRSNGATRQVRTAQSTVGATLKDAGIQVGSLDKVSPAIDQRPTAGMVIKVVRIYDAVESNKESIAYDSVKTFTRTLRPGQVKIDQKGSRGEKLVRYLVRYEDGVAIKRTVIGAKVLKAPKKEIASIGSACQYMSRGGEFRSRRVMALTATGYDPGPRSCGKYASGRTSCGLRAGYGVVAVDPRVIPLGTKLYVEGYGYAVAGDVGRAIKGSRIDLGFNSYSEAIRFGRKSVIVHMLDD